MTASMLQSPQVRLTVKAGGSMPLGPMTVEIIPDDGDSIEFVLSSRQPQHELDLPKGRYAIIARRSNGEKLRKSVTLLSKPELVSFADDGQKSPYEFMQPEAFRGEVGRGEPGTATVRGFAGEVLKSVLASKSAAFRDGAHLESLEEPIRELTICAWPMRRGAVIDILPPDTKSSLLKISIRKGCLAVGLLDESGFGPIVMTPKFRDGLNITFLAEGVHSWAARRYANPSGQRTPVALATPGEPRCADLLGALSVPTVEHAEAVWTQSFGDNAADALAFLSHKFAYPGEALLAAHYLLRFLPEKLPLKWADNLPDAYPGVADGPVIAAWLRLSSKSSELEAQSPEEIRRAVEALLRKAIASRVVLFARTRALLADGFRLQPIPLGNRLHPSVYLNYGAHAGGLESFWGRDRRTPGLAEPQRGRTEPHIKLGKVRLRGASFEPR